MNNGPYSVLNSIEKEQYYIKYDNPVENAYYNKVTFSKTTNFFKKCFCCVLDEKY